MNRKSDSTYPLLKAFCKVVQERREQLGISQEELAHRAGLHRTYISDIERGSRNVSLRSLIRLATALELTASSLIETAETKAASHPNLEGDIPTSNPVLPADDYQCCQ